MREKSEREESLGSLNGKEADDGEKEKTKGREGEREKERRDHTAGRSHVRLLKQQP